VKPHLVICRSCEGSGLTVIACRCGTGYGSYYLAHPDECVCEAPKCETCDGCGKVECDGYGCDVCDPEPVTSQGVTA
jgi:hypothetical protein